MKTIILQNPIKKKTAYLFFPYDSRKEIVLTGDIIEAIGHKANKRYLENLTDKEKAELIDLAFDKDNERYDFYYRTPNDNFVNAYDGEMSNNGWIETGKYSGKEFRKFYNLVIV